MFTPISDDMMVYVRSRDPDGTLRGILVEDDRQKNSRATILAETGRLVNGAARPARAAAERQPRGDRQDATAGSTC